MSTTQRFTALDVFRGMTLCFMIIVNNQYGPAAFAPLEHAEWDGFTPTDLVFPSFLFANNLKYKSFNVFYHSSEINVEKLKSVLDKSQNLLNTNKLSLPPLESPYERRCI